MTVTELLWKNLLHNLERGRCIVSVGPALPVLGPNRETINLETDLSKQLTAELPVNSLADRVHAHNLPLAAQEFLCQKTRGELETIVTRFYETWERQATSTDSVFAQLAKLPISTYITSRHDKLLEHALVLEQKKPTVDYYDVWGQRADNLRHLGDPTKPLVYHLLGSLRKPDSLVLAETDLLDVLRGVASGTPGFPTNLNNQLKDCGVLFLGCRLHHYYVRVLLHLLSIRESRARSLACEVQSSDPGNAFQELAHSAVFYSTGCRNLTLLDVDHISFLRELRKRWQEMGSTGGSAEVVPTNADLGR